jgi:hypothetical protein
LKISSSSIKYSNSISSKSIVSNIIEDRAIVIKASSNSIYRITSSIILYTNNNPIISNRVSNRCIIG